MVELNSRSLNAVLRSKHRLELSQDEDYLKT